MASPTPRIQNMCRRECRKGAGGSRWTSIKRLVPLWVLAGILSSGLAGQVSRSPILPPDAAARAFDAGRSALRRGDFPAAIKAFNEALATGHERPSQRIGTNRYFVERYDPHFGLGVAYMENGNAAKALECFRRSASYGLIQQWPEGAELTRRVQELEKAAPLAAAPLAAASPAEKPPPLPANTRVFLETPALLATQPPRATVTPPFEPRPQEPEEAAIPAPVATPLPSKEPSGQVSSRTKEDIKRVIDAISTADWARASALLSRLEKRNPDLPVVFLLKAVAMGSRYLLEGGKNEVLRSDARESLERYRKLGGSAALERVWLSPALAAALNR